MSLSAYARSAYGIGHEFRQMLQSETFEPYLRALSKRSLLELAEFCRANGDLVHKLSTATPAQQKKLLNKLPPDQQFWAIAGAAQIAFEAGAVLESADLNLQPGGGYRDMIGSVQTMLEAPYDCDYYNWPFPTFGPQG